MMDYTVSQKDGVVTVELAFDTRYDAILVKGLMEDICHGLWDAYERVDGKLREREIEFLDLLSYLLSW